MTAKMSKVVAEGLARGVNDVTHRVGNVKLPSYKGDAYVRMGEHAYVVSGYVASPTTLTPGFIVVHPLVQDIDVHLTALSYLVFGNGGPLEEQETLRIATFLLNAYFHQSARTPANYRAVVEAAKLMLSGASSLDALTQATGVNVWRRIS